MQCSLWFSFRRMRPLMGGGKVEQKTKPHQITLDLDLTNLKFNSVITIDLFEIQFNDA